MQFRLSGEYAPHHNGRERESDFQGHLQGSSFKKGLPADSLLAGRTPAVQTDKEYRYFLQYFLAQENTASIDYFCKSKDGKDGKVKNGYPDHNQLRASITKSRRKAPCFSYGDIRRIEKINKSMCNVALYCSKVYNISMKYKSSKNVVYSCKYHIVFCPKYRRPVLVNGVDERLKELIVSVCNQLNVDIIEMEIMPDLRFPYCKSLGRYSFKP